MTDNIDDILFKLYYIELNLDGVNELYRKAKLLIPSINKQDVSKWLKSQSVVQQTTIKPFIKESYKPIYSDTYNSFQIDLTFLKKYKNSNDGYNVLFTAININFRYAYVYYSKLKDSKSMIFYCK